MVHNWQDYESKFSKKQSRRLNLEIMQFLSVLITAISKKKKKGACRNK